MSLAKSWLEEDKKLVLLFPSLCPARCLFRKYLEMICWSCMYTPALCPADTVGA